MIDLDDHIGPSNILSGYKIGTVVSNSDPLEMGRLKVQIKGILEGETENLPWIAPRTNMSGASSSMGSLNVPKVGSKVTVEFPYNSPYVAYYSHSITPSADIPSYLKEDYPNNVGIFIEGMGFKYNKSSQILSINHPSGTVITILKDGTVSVKSPKDILVDGSGAKAKFSNGKIAFGSSEELMALLSETIQTMADSIGNMGYYLTTRPQFLELKARLDSIKGTL